MKCLVFPLLVIASLCSCKKSEKAIITSMTVSVNGQTSWTTSDVATDNPHDGNVFITGNSADKTQRVQLGLYEYRDGSKEYPIESHNGNYGGTAMLQDGTTTANGSSGQVAVTSETTTTISGTFTFTNNSSYNVSGTFTATKP